MTEKELLQEDRFRGFQEIESVKSNHEFYVDEFSRTKITRGAEYHQKSPGQKCENCNVKLIICMIQRISGTPNQCTVDNSHTFPVIPRYFFARMSEEICLAAPKLCRVTNGICRLQRESFLQVHLHTFRHPREGYPHHGTIQMQEEFPRGLVQGNPVTEDGDGPNPRFLRSSSTRDSFDLVKGRNFTNYGVGQQRLQIPETHFEKFPTPQRFLYWKIRFKTGVWTFSNTPLGAFLWIKELEMATSVDDLKSSRSIQGIILFLDFE